VAEELPLARDTAPAAEGLQFAVWRRLSPAEKFAAFLDLQQTAIALAEAGIRLRHPRASEREVFLRRQSPSTIRSPSLTAPRPNSAPPGSSTAY
jgi:hypothetical protein